MDFSINNQRILQLTLSFVIVNIVIECTVFVCLCVNTNPIVNDCHAHLKAILIQIPESGIKLIEKAIHFEKIQLGEHLATK